MFAKMNENGVLTVHPTSPLECYALKCWKGNEKHILEIKTEEEQDASNTDKN